MFKSTVGPKFDRKPRLILCGCLSPSSELLELDGASTAEGTTTSVELHAALAPAACYSNYLRSMDGLRFLHGVDVQSEWGYKIRE